ncbi:hypothetical protein BH10ACT7_BH10ACT7_17770 [soil metagenome]
MGFREWTRANLLTPDAVYGLILYSAVIAAVSDEDSNSIEILLFSVITLVIFWMAHVFAGTVAGHGDVRLRDAFRRSLGHSSGMLWAAILPSVPLILGAAHVMKTDDATSLALLVAMIVLGVLGYRSFAVRQAPVIVRVLGALGTAFFGMLIIILNYIVH